MKKTMVYVISILVTMMLIGIFFVSKSEDNSIGVALFEGSISGIITLIGLVVTFIGQQQVERCPGFVLMQLKCSPIVDNKILGRKVTVKITNIKSAWAVNCRLEKEELGTIEREGFIEKDIFLKDVGPDSNERIVIEFQDAYGKKYSQSIKYIFKEKKYIFISEETKEKG